MSKKRGMKRNSECTGNWYRWNRRRTEYPPHTARCPGVCYRRRNRPARWRWCRWWNSMRRSDRREPCKARHCECRCHIALSPHARHCRRVEGRPEIERRRQQEVQPKRRPRKMPGWEKKRGKYPIVARRLRQRRGTILTKPRRTDRTGRSDRRGTSIPVRRTALQTR